MNAIAPPPQNLDAEESVIGAILLGGGLGLDAGQRVLARVREALDPTDFYRESHAKIYRAALALTERGEPVDAIAVVSELEARGELEGAGGRPRIHELAALVPATANVAHYAKIVHTTARRRHEGRLASGLARAALDGGLAANDNLRAELAALLNESPQGSARLEPLDLTELLAGEPPEVAWLWNGWLARGDLALLVGDPGVGKSVMGLALANTIRQGGELLDEPCQAARVGVFDLEMPLEEAHKRLRQIGLTADEHEGIAYFHAAPIDLTKPAGVAALREAVERYELDLFVIDSLRRAAPGMDENDSAAVASVFAPLRELTATSGRTGLVVHHPRKRSADASTEASQMVRGSGDLVASVDVLLYVRSKGDGTFTLESGKSRRGRPHEPILVRLEDEDGLMLINEGSVATADDKVEAILAQITKALADDGGALPRQVIALRVDKDPKDGTFSRALKLGWQRGLLAKTERERPTDPQLYALAEGVNA